MIGKGEKGAKARGGKRSGYDHQRRVGVSGAAGFAVLTLLILCQNCSRHPNPRGNLQPFLYSCFSRPTTSLTVKRTAQSKFPPLTLLCFVPLLSCWRTENQEAE